MREGDQGMAEFSREEMERRAEILPGCVRLTRAAADTFDALQRAIHCGNKAQVGRLMRELERLCPLREREGSES